MGVHGEQVMHVHEAGESGPREFKLTLTVERDGGKMTGFTVRAEPQGEAEWFCKTFPEGMRQGRAGVHINIVGLMLLNPNCPFQPGVKLFPASADAGSPFTPQDMQDMREHAEAGGGFTVEELHDPLGFRVHHC